jgi:hypothetical protein
MQHEDVHQLVDPRAGSTLMHILIHVCMHDGRRRPKTVVAVLKRMQELVDMHHVCMHASLQHDALAQHQLQLAECPDRPGIMTALH